MVNGLAFSVGSWGEHLPSGCVAHPGDMSSRDEDKVSAPEATLGQEGREHLEDPLISPGVAEDKMCFPVSKTFQYDSWFDSDEMEGRSVIWGCEGWPGTPVDERGQSLDFVPQLTVNGTKLRAVCSQSGGLRCLQTSVPQKLRFSSL